MMSGISTECRFNVEKTNSIQRASPISRQTLAAATLKMLEGYDEVSILVQTIVLLSVSSKCHVPEAMPELLITNS